jgi:coenzyme F420-0:L-glutamate ligase / coenzyme F420-1:gamma-L-glutamate ligase
MDDSLGILLDRARSNEYQERLPGARDNGSSSSKAAILEELMQGRRSVRRYLDLGVPDQVIAEALEAARWAPSPHNSQPWRFAVLRSPSSRELLASALGDRWRADLAADGMTTAQIDQLIGKSRERIGGAPLVIILSLTWTDLDVYPDQRRQAAEQLMAAHSLGAAAQNIMLTAHAHGVASCWMCAPLFCPEVVREALKLPEDVIPQALITLGYPAVVQPVRGRRPISELVLLDA